MQTAMPATATFNSNRVRALRDEYGLTQQELGAIVYGYDSDAMNRKAGHRLEKPDFNIPAAVRRTLERLEDGRLDPEMELRFTSSSQN
jgi:DNA-binding XRE family transcriptional regulator